MKQLLFYTVNEVYNYTREVSKADSTGVILFVPTDKIMELSQNVPTDFILCSTAGEYTCKGYRDGVITGFEYEKEEADIVEIPHPAIKALHDLKKAYLKVKNNRNAFMLLLCDGLNKTEESILSIFYFMNPEFKIIGGSAGDNLKFKETYIFIGSKRVQNLAVFFNIERKTCILKENIYTKTGESLLVTEADVLKRVVKTFNNHPASTEYARVIGVEESVLPKYFMNHPLGKVYEEDTFIASPMKVNKDKSITFYCELMENTFLDVLKPENPLEVLTNTIKMAPFKPSFILSIHCVLRSLKFIEEDKWEVFDRKMLEFCNNITGFVSYGEQYYNRHSNQTMVLLLIE